MITPKEINEQCAKWWKEVLMLIVAASVTKIVTFT